MAKLVALLALLVGQADSFVLRPATRVSLAMPRSRLAMGVNENGEASAMSNNAAKMNLRKVQLEVPRDLSAKRRRSEQVQEYELDEEGKVVANPEQASRDELAAQEMVTNIQQRTMGPQEKISEMANKFGGQKGILLAVAGTAFVGYTGVKVAKSSISGYKKKQAELVKDYAFEMIRDDGNEKVLREIHAEYSKKLGPGSKKEDLFKEYLRMFFAKKTLSGAMIRSLAFAISLNGATDDKVADYFLELSEEAAKKPIMRGKILFLAERIIKDPTAVAKLDPIRQSIIATFESEEGMQIAQDFLAETALKTYCNKKATDLEGAVAEGMLLGFSAQRAKAIFEEVQSPDFVSETDYYYKVKNEEKEDPAEALKQKMAEEGTDVSDIDNFDLDAKDDADGSGVGPSAPSSGGSLIAECTKCGYTMFVAKGREDKFFGDAFTCPTCNCGKEDFTTRSS